MICVIKWTFVEQFVCHCVCLLVLGRCHHRWESPIWIFPVHTIRLLELASVIQCLLNNTFTIFLGKQQHSPLVERVWDCHPQFFGECNLYLYPNQLSSPRLTIIAAITCTMIKKFQPNRKHDSAIASHCDACAIINSMPASYRLKLAETSSNLKWAQYSFYSQGFCQIATVTA